MFFTVEDPDKLVKQKSRNELKTLKNMLQDNIVKLAGKTSKIERDNKERNKTRDNEQ